MLILLNPHLLSPLLIFLLLLLLHPPKIRPKVPLGLSQIRSLTNTSEPPVRLLIGVRGRVQ